MTEERYEYRLIQISGLLVDGVYAVYSFKDKEGSKGIDYCAVQIDAFSLACVTLDGDLCSNEIVGLELIDGSFEIVNEAANFTGLYKREQIEEAFTGKVVEYPGENHVKTGG